MGCAHCGAPLAVAASGRPRRYCSAACRQRSYRERVAGRTALDLGALAALVRDRAELLRLVCQGWHPPDGGAVRALFADTAVLTAELSVRCRAWAGVTESRDETRSR